MEGSPAMEEVRELKRHIQWLEDRAEWDDGLGDAIDQINSKLDTVDENVNKMVDAVNHNANVLRLMVDAFRQIVDAINRPATPRPPPPFDEIFGALCDRGKRRPAPKRPSSKLKVVKDDAPPDQPA
jgi:hypothetical protein